MCVYRPGVKSQELKLSIDKPSDDIPKCPNCNYEFPIREEGDGMPEKCDQYGIAIQKFLDIQERDAERDKIKQELLRNQRVKYSSEQQKRQQQQEEKQKKQLEDEIKKELSIKDEKKSARLAGSALLVVILAGGSYAFLSQQPQEDQPNPEQLISISDTPELPQDGQQSLQEGYERASKVLEAFGLNPDAVTGGNPSASSGTNKALVPASALLLNKGFNTQIWQHFLITEIEVKIVQKKEPEAYHLSQYINGTKSYIDMLGQLLIISKQVATKNNIDLDIQNKIFSLPKNEQIQFLVQAGLYQYKADKTHIFLDQASTLWEGLKAPEERLDAILALGVVNFKLGSIKAANQYFGKVAGLLNEVSSIDKKIHSRVAIAKAYREVGSNDNAHQWLSSTDKLIPDASNSVYAEIVAGYAYLDELESTLKIIQLHPVDMSQDSLLYKAIQVFVSLGSYDNASELVGRLQGVNYRVTSNILMASHVQKNSDYLAQIEAQINKETTHSLDKAVLLSYLALQYSIQSDIKKTEALFQLTKNELNTTSPSLEKDEALVIISTNYSHILNTTYAHELLAFTQSPALQSTFKTEIANGQNVAALIN